ncbi:MAG: protein kinase, partial [Clostridia bacterium]|nr:protein kinase [Clostridia bacterium]
DAFLHGVEQTIEESRKLAGFSQLESVVTVYDTFRANGTAYIVMEYLTGSTVKEIVREKGKFSYSEARAIIIPVLKTLERVHKTGIIHRDISPDNIFICDDEDKHVKLLDFGAAKMTEALDEKSRTVVLKQGYAPIEQYSSTGKQGTWTDVYAVAATLYFMLSGQVPISAADRSGKDSLPDIAAFCPGIPRDVSEAVMQCLSVAVNNRPKKVSALLDALSEATKTLPVDDSTILMTKEEQEVMERWMRSAGDTEKFTQKEIDILTRIGIIKEGMLKSVDSPVIPPEKVSVPVKDNAEENDAVNNAHYEKEPAEAVYPGNNPKNIKKIIPIIVAAVLVPVIGAGVFALLHRRKPEPVPQETLTEKITTVENSTEDIPDPKIVKEAFVKFLEKNSGKITPESGFYGIDSDGDGAADIMLCDHFSFSTAAVTPSDTAAKSPADDGKVRIVFYNRYTDSIEEYKVPDVFGEIEGNRKLTRVYLDADDNIIVREDSLEIKSETHKMHGAIKILKENLEAGEPDKVSGTFGFDDDPLNSLVLAYNEFDNLFNINEKDKISYRNKRKDKSFIIKEYGLKINKDSDEENKSEPVIKNKYEGNYTLASSDETIVIPLFQEPNIYSKILDFKKNGTKVSVEDDGKNHKDWSRIKIGSVYCYVQDKYLKKDEIKVERSEDGTYYIKALNIKFKPPHGLEESVTEFYIESDKTYTDLYDEFIADKPDYSVSYYDSQNIAGIDFTVYKFEHIKPETRQSNFLWQTTQQSTENYDDVYYRFYGTVDERTIVLTIYLEKDNIESVNRITDQILLIDSNNI